jgi:hypothetical protein
MAFSSPLLPGDIHIAIIFFNNSICASPRQSGRMPQAEETAAGGPIRKRISRACDSCYVQPQLRIFNADSARFCEPNAMESLHASIASRLARHAHSIVRERSAVKLRVETLKCRENQVHWLHGPSPCRTRWRQGRRSVRKALKSSSRRHRGSHTSAKAARRIIAVAIMAYGCRVFSETALDRF